MKVGFTGTRAGMNDYQKNQVENLLYATMNPFDITEVHHGDCIGADTDFHNMCLGFLPIVIHPSNLLTRAWNEGAVRILEPKAPLVRDRDIVDSIDVLIATPRQCYEITRSGTWATVRYARKMHKLIYIIYPTEETKHGS